MCLAIPMKITKLGGDGMAEVEAGSLPRTVNIQMCPGARRGDYVLVHAGFAIQKVDKREAEETLRLLQDM